MQSITPYAAALLAVSLSCSAHANWPALRELERTGARVSASAVELYPGTSVEELNADTRLTPASLTKLVTAAAILDAWPSETAFRTTLLASAPIRDGVLTGDVILRGAGDPSLDDQALWTLAAQLKGEGVHRIAGRVLVSPAPFGHVPCGTQDRCEALRRSGNAFNAPMTSIGVDFGAWCVAVKPTSPGEAARVRGCGVAALPIPVVGTVITGSPGSALTLRVERETIDAGDRLRIGGEVPLGRSQRVYRAMSDPSRGVGLLLAQTLRELGIETPETVVVSEEPLPPNAYLLAEVEGLSLHEQLGRMLRFSNNYIADVLTLDHAARITDHPPADLSSAAQSLLQFLVPTTSTGPRAGDAAPVLASGSGLTVENRLSASDLTRLLASEYRDTRHFPVFYGGLTVPRDAAFDFLRHGSDAWLDRVALKTGTLNDPVSVCGIAGYLRQLSGAWVAFAVIVNGGPARRHVPLATVLAAAQSDLEQLLAGTS